MPASEQNFVGSDLDTILKCRLTNCHLTGRKRILLRDLAHYVVDDGDDEETVSKVNFKGGLIVQITIVVVRAGRPETLQAPGVRARLLQGGKAQAVRQTVPSLHQRARSAHAERGG